MESRIIFFVAQLDNTWLLPIGISDSLEISDMIFTTCWNSDTTDNLHFASTLW